MRVGVYERPELAELPEALAPLHPWGQAIAGARPDERFGGVAGQAEGAEPGQEIPEGREGLLVELAGIVERIQGIQSIQGVQGVQRAAGKEDGSGYLVADPRDLAQAHADGPAFTAFTAFTGLTRRWAGAI